MASYRRRVFWPGILAILLSSSVLTENSELDVDSILEEIQNEYKKFEIGEQKSIVLVLGNTGTGKSTLALLLSGAYLEAKRVSPGVFSIEDKNDLISGHSTTVSKTKVPNLMIDKETNTSFYDCPGFADSRGVVIDIIATRSIHKLLNFANEIKLLITVSYQSVLNVIGDRRNLSELAGHIIRLIKNFEKYAKGMTLVVTKVQNLKDYNDEGEEILVDDETVIESIAKFINQTKNDLVSKGTNKMTFEERKLNEDKIKFFEIFLERERNKYTRINIFRLVDRPGPLKKMKIIENEKEAINTAINYYTDYVPTDADDFGYSISDESRGYLAKLITKLEDRLEKYAGNICTDLKSFYNDETQLMNSVKNIQTEIGVDNLFQLHSNGEFIKHFNQSAVNLDIRINADNLKNISRSVEFVDFLNSISEKESTTISERMKGTLKLCASELFDEVKTQLRIDVPKAIFDIQQNYVERGHPDSQMLNILQTVFSIGLDETSGLNATVLRSLLDLTSDGHDNLFSRSMAFFGFVQLLNDKDRVLSAKMSRELKECVKETENKLLDSVSSIFNAIEAFFKQEEKKNCLNLENIRMTMSMIQQKLSKIGTNSWETFVKDLLNVAMDLNIGQHGKDGNILREIEFLKCVNGNLSISEKISSDLNTFKKYVDDSKTWYSFLLKLRDHLLTYNVQQNRALRDEGEAMLKISNEDYNKNKLKLILDSLNETLFTDVIGNMKINVSKLKALKAVWSQTMGDFESSCTSDRLIVKGYVVSISNIVKLDCWPNAKFIDIFALNKLFFDAEIVKNDIRAELSIISPIWEIVALSTKKTQIQMQGKHGYDLAAYPAVRQIRSGTDGFPGGVGGPGGSVLSIGGSFINSHHLLINVSGGDGGTGQPGSEGGDGVQGRDPTGSAEDIYEAGVYHHAYRCMGAGEEVINMIVTNLVLKRYECYGYDGSRGGRGGNGGCGGFGGNPGKFSVIGLEKIPRFTILNKTGERGASAFGGLGGRATRNGRVFQILRKSSAFATEYHIENKRLGDVVPAGDDGGYGTSCNDIARPVEVFAGFQPSSITAYQEYARENLLNNIWRANLVHFINDLTNNDAVDSFFNVIALYEEFVSLEKQYFHLHKEIDFTPFYQSLRNRIEKYVKRSPIQSIDEQKSVKLLYTAVISKLLSMKSQANQIAVSDLLTYIATIKVNIAKLKKYERIEYITKQRINYERSLNEKIKSATELVQKMVVPAIDKIFDEIGSNVQELLSEAVVKHNENEEALEITKENKEKLKKSILGHNMLAPVKLIGSFLPLAGPQGAIAGAAVSGGATFTESVVDGGLTTKNIASPAAPYGELLKKIKNNFNREKLLFSEQLSDLDKISGANNSTEFKEIRKVIRNVQNEIIKSDKNFQTNVTNELETGKKAVQISLNETRNYYNILKKEGKDVDSALGNIETMQKLIKVSDVGVDIYKQNRDDEQKLDEINEQIDNLHGQLNTWKQYEEDIKQIMMPQLNEMQLSFDKSSKNLAGKPHVVLDISKWKIQGALSDLKKLFREMAQAQDSLLEGDLVHLIEKIGEGMTTMISVYDRIDSYAEQSKLAALISDVTTGPTYIDDPTLKKAAFTLDKIIQTNLVLERFESVMHALKQHKFPHARQYLEVFYNLPSDLQSDNTEDVLQRVTENIDDLESKLKISKSTLQVSDVSTFSDRYFDSIQPFYTWHHQDFESDIRQLLNGTQISLKSDITKGVNFNAVKFKEISINLKLANETRQRELNEKLEKFEIVMTMIGNNYYRCNNRIYYIPLDKDVTFIFHFRNGIVSGKNDIHQKISDSDYFLSPYTVWNIQLISKESQSQIGGNFESFKYDKIDLQLTGVGQIIKDKIKNELDVCSNDLDNYYTIDGIY